MNQHLRNYGNFSVEFISRKGWVVFEKTLSGSERQVTRPIPGTDGKYAAIEKAEKLHLEHLMNFPAEEQLATPIRMKQKTSPDGRTYLVRS